MLAHRHMGAPSSFHQPGWPHIMFFLSFGRGNDSITSQLRLTSTSDCFPHQYQIYKSFKVLVCCIKGIWVHPFISFHPPNRPQIFGILGPLCLWSEKVTVEDDIHLRLLPTSILDIHKVFEVFVCCLTGIWGHPYIVPPAKLAQDFGVLSHF